MKVSEVKIGHKLTSPKDGMIGLVCDVGKKSITVVWENGLKVKNTYKSIDSYFYVIDFI